MSRIRTISIAASALLCLVSFGRADTARLERGGIVRKGATATSYSVEVPVVARVQGTAFFRTSLDINNNTNNGGVTAQYQFSYTCVAPSCSPVGGFYRTALQTVTLPAISNFHQDDFVDYLDSLGLLAPGAAQGSIGTLLVTFASLPSSQGWEATAVGRTYNRLNEADPLSGTVGFAYNASLFFESADTTVIGYARDTKSSPTVAGKLRSNVGIRSTDISATNQNVTVVVTTYDTVTGARVGNAITLANIQPGELRQISDLWATAGIPSSVNSVIVFADNPSPTNTSPTFEGYVTIIDGQVTQDAAFFEMRCADANGCGN